MLASVLFSSPSLASSGGVSAVESIKAMEGLIKPSLTQSTDWSMKVGLGMVSGTAFYALVVKFIKL